MHLCICVYKDMFEMHALNSSGQCLFPLWATIWFRASCWELAVIPGLSPLTHAFGAEVPAQARATLLHDDPGSLLLGLGVNAAHVGRSLVKEETASTPFILGNENSITSLLLVLVPGVTERAVPFPFSTSPLTLFKMR